MTDLTPKVQKKRETILKTSLRVFAKEGFHNADVQVIADLAKVGKGTVYRHFGNKEQLFLATARYSAEQLGEFVKEKLGSDEQAQQDLQREGTIEMLRRIALACAEFYQKHPQAVEIMIHERAEFREGVYPSHLMFRVESREGFDQMLEDAMRKGELRELDVTETTNAFSDLIFGSVVNGCLEGGKTKLVQRMEKAVDVMLYGLAARNVPRSKPTRK